jgi:ubiquinone/menaquinone biosynthesis C-methylase UbiE
MLSHEEAWRRYDAVEVRLTAPVSERMLDLADLRPGMRVLDLATGRGEPALRAAQRVGPEGLVVGVDLSDGLLEMARERGDGMGLANLDLRVGNAEELHDLPSAHFHAVTARWGLMYMTDPVAALAAARRALVPTGVLVAAFWAEPECTPFISLPRRLLERYRDVPEIDVEVPGPFRYDAPERITRDFDRAGLAVDHVEEMETPVFEAEAATEVVDWARVFGMEKLLAELPESDQRAWEQDFASEMERGRTGGLIQVGGVTRIVRARPSEPKR